MVAKKTIKKKVVRKTTVKKKTTKSKKDKEYPQTGKTIDIEADKKRGALKPGPRISKNGNKYYEARKNRSDRKGKKV